MVYSDSDIEANSGYLVAITALRSWSYDCAVMLRLGGVNLVLTTWLGANLFMTPDLVAVIVMAFLFNIPLAVLETTGVWREASVIADDLLLITDSLI